jgi:hypothetical protein
MGIRLDEQPHRRAAKQAAGRLVSVNVTSAWSLPRWAKHLR